MAETLISFEEFVRIHQSQLEKLEVPKNYWRTIYEKITIEIYDAGEYFTIAKDDSGTWHVFVTNEDGLEVSDSNGIFLVDHAWTFEAEYARRQLQSAPELLVRIAALTECVDENDQEISTGEVVDKAMEKIWLYSQMYKVAKTVFNKDGSVEADKDLTNNITLWYIMDEFGARFSHSDQPNMAFKLFYHVPSELSYTLIYPLRNIEYQEEATRDFLGDIDKDRQRDARLFPWHPDRLNLEEVADEWVEKIEMDKVGEDPLVTAIGCSSTLENKILRVFSESSEVSGFLTHPNFVLHNDKETADILWLYDHFKEFRSLAKTPGRIVNQFPSESVLTNKDQLAEVARRSLKVVGHSIDTSELENRGPVWLPMTYNLYTELPQFIKCFVERENRGMDNTWICKPWNLGRGLEHTVTNCLNQIIKLVDTGPKVVCKYIEDPVLFCRDDVGQVKFDVRYMVALNSVQPLKLYAYKIFYTRFANISYSLDDFEMYEKHLTVMNYREGAELKQVHWDDFKVLFEKQNPGQQWDVLEEQTFEIIRTLFKAAVSQPAPNGISHNPQCRAIYGLDFMYKWKGPEKTSIQPMLIEVNYFPSLKRCCKYQPHLINDFFDMMFFNKLGDYFVELS